MTFILFGILLGMWWVKSDAGYLKYLRWQKKQCHQIESELAEMGVNDATTVFTDDFDLYFTGLNGYRPRYNGGWGPVGLYRYNEICPPIPTEELDLFKSHLNSGNFRAIVFTSDYYHPLIRQIMENDVYPVKRIGKRKGSETLIFRTGNKSSAPD